MSPRRFRIERSTGVREEGAADEAASARHAEVLRAIDDLRRVLIPAGDATAPAARDHGAQLTEVRKLKAGLDEIHAAIADTKREIATLHRTGMRDRNSVHVTDELDAIVADTEHATETILAVAETVDRHAGDLVAALRGVEADIVRDIQENVVRIFEACNFQDLTGQRITRIVGVLHFIEERVERMMEIWRGFGGFEDIVAEEHPVREGDAALLNGPALAGAEGIASQDDIDALFD